MLYHIKKQASPDAPKNDIIKESAVVFKLQLFITLRPKIRQNPPHKNKVNPKIKVNSKCPSEYFNKNNSVGASAPPIIPTLPFCAVWLLNFIIGTNTDANTRSNPEIKKIELYILNFFIYNHHFFLCEVFNGDKPVIITAQ